MALDRPVHAPGTADGTAAQNKRVPPRQGYVWGFYAGAWRVTSRLSLGSGQGSGSSHTRFQSRPRCRNRLSRAMPWRITLTVRTGCCGPQR